MSVRILADSSADVTKETREKITVIPLNLFFGEEEYKDGVSITYQEFYEKLVEYDDLPHTSQANPDTFARYFEEVKEKDETAVVITLASTLSGTYQSALIAAEDYEDRIYVVDSLNATIGSGILVELAVKYAESGMSAKEIAKNLEEERDKICLMGIVDTLEYLKKGGRISKTAAVAGEVLGIKPVLRIKDGEIIVLGKARGSKRSNNLLVQEIEKAGGVDFDKPVMLAYSGLSDILLQKYVEDSRSLWEGHTDELKQSCIGSVIGTHLGPGAVAVAFFSKNS
ncbi:MAG: DegV family protein [Lachnospiraceae bacterium]|nr:DegV family protein [Lachnospiraceae bacterium]